MTYTEAYSNLLAMQLEQSMYIESLTKSLSWQPGDEVVVYHDPVTERKPEGIAELLKKYGEDGPYVSPRLERWKVRFIDTGEITSRFIKRKDE